MALPLIRRLGLQSFFEWIKLAYKSHPVGLQGEYAENLAEIAEAILVKERKGFKKVSGRCSLEDGILVVAISALAYDIYSPLGSLGRIHLDYYRTSYKKMLERNLEGSPGESLAESVMAIVDYVNGVRGRELSREEAFLAGILLDSKKIYILHNRETPACRKVLEKWISEGAQSMNDKIYSKFAREFIWDCLNKS